MWTFTDFAKKSFTMSWTQKSSYYLGKLSTWYFFNTIKKVFKSIKVTFLTQREKKENNKTRNLQ